MCLRVNNPNKRLILLPIKLASNYIVGVYKGILIAIDHRENKGDEDNG